MKKIFFFIIIILFFNISISFSLTPTPTPSAQLTINFYYSNRVVTDISDFQLGGGFHLLTYQNQNRPTIKIGDQYWNGQKYITVNCLNYLINHMECKYTRSLDWTCTTSWDNIKRIYTINLYATIQTKALDLDSKGNTCFNYYKMHSWFQTGPQSFDVSCDGSAFYTAEGFVCGWQFPDMPEEFWHTNILKLIFQNINAPYKPPSEYFSINDDCTFMETSTPTPTPIPTSTPLHTPTPYVGNTPTPRPYPTPNDDPIDPGPDPDPNPAPTHIPPKPPITPTPLAGETPDPNAIFIQGSNIDRNIEFEDFQYDEGQVLGKIYDIMSQVYSAEEIQELDNKKNVTKQTKHVEKAATAMTEIADGLNEAFLNSERFKKVENIRDKIINSLNDIENISYEETNLEICILGHKTNLNLEIFNSLFQLVRKILLFFLFLVYARFALQIIEFMLGIREKFLIIK